MGGEVLLIVGQDADPVAPAAREHLVHPAAPERDQHERRAQRDRQEAVGGHAVDRVALDRRDHGHAGGEPPHDLAELPRRLLDRGRLRGQPGDAGRGEAGWRVRGRRLPAWPGRTQRRHQAAGALGGPRHPREPRHSLPIGHGRHDTRPSRSRRLRSAGGSCRGRRTGSARPARGSASGGRRACRSRPRCRCSAYWTAIRHSAIERLSVGLRVPLVTTPTRWRPDVHVVAVAGGLVAFELEPDEPPLRVLLALDQRVAPDEVLVVRERDREPDARPRTGRPGRRTRSRRRSAPTRSGACRAPRARAA